MSKICKEIGDDITYESSFKRVCKRVFGGRFAGVHPRDKMESILGKFEKGKEKPKTIEKTKYYIFNLDTRAEGGSHWCACVIQDRLVHIYDSFGRDIQNKFRLERQRTKNGRDELWSALYCVAFGVP